MLCIFCGRQSRAALFACIIALHWCTPVRSEERAWTFSNAAIQDLTDAYRLRPSAERIEVTHRSAGVERREVMTVVVIPPTDARLEFGPYVVWITKHFVRVIHRDDMKSFFQRPVSPSGPLGTLEEIFPPLPAPQLALAFAPSDRLIELTPYCRDVLWSAPVDAGSPDQERLGEGPRVRARLLAHDGRLARLLIRADEGQEVEIRATAIQPFDFDRAMESELNSRVEAQSVAGLRPRAGDSGVGSPLPPLLLATNALDQAANTPAGPCAILFFDRVDANLAIARDALRAVQQKRPSVTNWPTLVADIFEPRLSFRVDEARLHFEPAQVYVSLSPETTVERFSEANRSVLVVVDESSIVRAVMPIGESGSVGGELTPADRAARVNRLAEQVLDALRPPPATP